MPSITFNIEDLEPPGELLEEKPLSKVLEQFAAKIESSSRVGYDLVPMGYHPFLYSMYRAYAEHRPFVLSPDMIWLVICQGFSHHINFNAHKEHHLFPNLKKKQVLTITSEAIKLGETTSQWGDAAHCLTEQLAKYIDQQLIDALRADFSTTSSVERIASEITILDTFKAYFEYQVVYMICGIPQITLEGEPNDWYKIITKLEHLTKFGLDDWVNDLKPIIQEIAHTSEGQVDKDFWMNMFKVHTRDEYGNPKKIDGWITYFYLYDKNGNQARLKEREGLDVEDIIAILPKELVCVDFEYLIKINDDEIVDQVPMEYWAGFIGVQQDKNTFALRPEIGWFVSYRDETKVRNEGKRQEQTNMGGYFNLTDFPAELLNDDREWRDLTLVFQDEVKLPSNFPEISAEILRIQGKIAKNQKEEIENLQIRLYFEKEINLVVNGVWPIGLDGFFEYSS